MMSNHAFYQKVSNKETVDIDIAFVIQVGFSLVHLFSESKRPLSRNLGKGPSRKDFSVGSDLPPTQKPWPTVLVLALVLPLPLQLILQLKTIAIDVAIEI